MKLNTNFVSSTLIVTPAIGLTVWVTSILLILLSFILIVDRQQMSADIATLKNENEQISLKAKKSVNYNEEVLPSFKDLQQLMTKVSALNEVSGVKGISIANLLTRIELALPKDTFLRSLDHFPRKGEVLITATSTKADLLTHFLRQLEKDKHFERVMLVHQSKNVSQKNVVQFDLRLVMSR